MNDYLKGCMGVHRFPDPSYVCSHIGVLRVDLHRIGGIFLGVTNDLHVIFVATGYDCIWTAFGNFASGFLHDPAVDNGGNGLLARFGSLRFMVWWIAAGRYLWCVVLRAVYRWFGCGGVDLRTKGLVLVSCFGGSVTSTRD